MTPIRLRVIGIPQPKGSIRVLPRCRFPQLMRHFGDILRSIIVTSDNPKLKAWEREIQKAAAIAAHGREAFTGAIEIAVVFTFERPKSASVKKRPDHTVKPDLSKLVRGIEDSLSGLIYHDDAQIVATHSSKQYGVVPGVEITIQPAVSDSLFAPKERAS